MTTVLQTRPTDVPAAAPAGLAGGRIVVDGVDHEFETDTGVVAALQGISLDISPGEFVSLVGTSGCGKSTLLNIIAGLLTPTRGTVTIGRADATSDGLPQRAYITQDDRLLPWRTAAQNVELPLQLHGIPRRERAERARAILARVGLADFVDRRPHELSGGMRQRVSIAQSLVYHPAVLLMDEPFGALDVWTRESLHELLLDVQAELGTTVVLVTHDVGEAIALSDRVVTLAPRPGRIFAEHSLADQPRPRSHHTLHDEFFVAAHERIRADLGFDN